MAKHRLIIDSLYDGEAHCSQEDWWFRHPGEITKERIKEVFKKHTSQLPIKAETNGIRFVFQPNTGSKQYEKGFPHGRYAWTAYDIETNQKLAAGDDQEEVYRQALARKKQNCAGSDKE